MSWGYNLFGQLGNNSTSNSSIPLAVTTAGTPLADKVVVAVSAGTYHNLVLCADGTLATWGYNASGQLGNGSTTRSLVPVAVMTAGTPLAGKSVVSFAAGGSHNIALCSDGTVVTWGNNGNGQLGNNSTTQSTVPVAVNTSGVLAGKTVIGVAAGNTHSLALCSDGTMAAWGSNNYGQLGNTTTTDSSLPVGVSTGGVLAGKTVVRLMAGAAHSMVLCSDGTMAAWGNNAHGQLGDNSTTQSSIPVAVSTSTLAAGENFVLSATGQAALHNLSLVASPVPATVTTFAATSATATTAVLNGTVNANGGAATVAFDYGLDGTYGGNAVGTPASVTGAGNIAVSTALTGLTPNTTYHFRANGRNGSGVANGADLTFTTLTLLQNWRQTSFGTTSSSGSMADAADYDGDGIPNLVEYALNLSPTAVSKLPVTTALNGANFEFTYSRGTAAVNAGTSFAVEWSGALPATWSNNGITQTVLSDDGTTQVVKAVIPVNAATTMFVRLSVTAPP